MHWAMRGAQNADLYVTPSGRGLGAALPLIACACREVWATGGAFLRGGAYDRPSTRTFFSRVAVVAPSGNTNLSGRAFRRLAQLEESSVRGLLQHLPLFEWNLEP